MKSHILAMLLVMGSPCMNSLTLFCNPVDLKCDHLVNPLGVDHAAPRLSWRLDDVRKGARQTAYQLIVSTDSLQVVKNIGTVWDTQKVQSDAILVAYNGQEIQPFTAYYWKVKTWDQHDHSQESAIAVFETGMMGEANWKGAWISDHHDIHYKPALYFRKSFHAHKKIQSARIYIAAAGLYELSLNGEKIGNHCLDPMYTRFDRRIMYVTHDATSAIRQGENAIGVLLGNGWYNHQSLAVWDFHQAPWRARPAFCLDLRIRYEDGSVETISSERDWKTSSGPLIFNSIYTGEHYDARLEQEGWNNVGFDDSKWGGVRYRSVPAATITSQQMVPVRAVTEYLPISMNQINDSILVFDMGQNMSGVTQIKLSGKEGSVVKIRHAERLYKDGRTDLSNIDVYYRGPKESEPFQTDVLILSGKKEDEFRAKFNYKGFLIPMNPDLNIFFFKLLFESKQTGMLSF